MANGSRLGEVAEHKTKTEIMKNITFINRQSDVLNDVLKDCEIEKLKQQCEN